MNPAAAPIDLIDYGHYRGAEGYRLLQHCLAGRREPESVLQALARAGWQDHAGGTAAAADKWRGVRSAAGPRRLVVRVGDGGPDDTRDRLLLESDPHRFFEGLLIACWAAGIDEAIVQLADAHQACRETLLQELETLQQELPVSGLTPIRLGRATPGAPATLAQEVETLHALRGLCESGADGLRWYAVTGRVREPGLRRARAGCTVQQLIDDHGGGLPSGQRVYAFVRGGSEAGCILPSSELRLALDAGGVMVLSEHDNAVDAARSLLQSAVRELREPGELVAARRLDALIVQPQWTPALLGELVALLRGLGATSDVAHRAGNTVASLARHFRAEVQ